MRYRSALLALASLLLGPALCGKTVVFWQEGFPSVDSQAPPRAVLEQALHALSPVFVSLDDLLRPETLQPGDLLVLPYGSAFPADAWDAIRQRLDQINLLNIGGRPFTVPVWREAAGWRAGPLQTIYSRSVGIDHTLIAPESTGRFAWDSEEIPFIARFAPPNAPLVKARRVFVLASDGNNGRRCGLGFFLNAKGDRLVAPVIADDLNQSRRVYLNFDPQPGYWDSLDGVGLLAATSFYAARAPVRIWVDLDRLTIEPGDRVSGTIDLRGTTHPPASLRLELCAGDRVQSSLNLVSEGAATVASIHQAFTFPVPLSEPGLYAVRATYLSANGQEDDRYTTGFWVRDVKLLHSGLQLEAGRDYFRLAGKPFLPVGANYFSTDPLGASFFVGGSIGGNAWLWERDFAEMEKQGVTMVRTGVWLNRARYLESHTDAAGERFLRAVEAFLHSAARHHMQVVFTLFAFEPQTIESPGPGQDRGRLGPGSNPYTDQAAIADQRSWVESIASRFKNVPFFSFDLVNEPSFSNPRQLWKGNTPNADPTELAAWREWLAHRYASPAALAEAWHIPAAEIGSISTVALPDPSDLEPSRIGNLHLTRAIDYNLFAQDAFSNWATAMISAIRAVGARQAIAVGQDEGGVANRVLNQFYGAAALSYTVNHTWWRDDALLWDSLMAKRPDKPNLIGETGPQPAWSPDGNWRWDESTVLPLHERKLVLGFAAANAGVLHWDWARGDTFGLLRQDGSYKPWMETLSGIAAFAQAAQPFATETHRPDIAIIIPQSLQLSAWNNIAVETQQKSVRALYNYARQSAYAVGEYQLDLLGDPKLIIVPAPWIFKEAAWSQLIAKVRAGATLLISGRIDADEHFWSRPTRTQDWAPGYQPGLLTTRENTVSWPGGSAPLTYPGDLTTLAERGVLPDGATFLETQLGSGRLLYVALPLELAESLDSISRVYRYAIGKAGIGKVYEASTEDPGILICPTQLPDGTLYALTSESSAPAHFSLRDLASGATFDIHLAPGRAALALITNTGKLAASYNLQ
jgi:hypothetical protein